MNPIVSAGWLADRLKEPDLRIVDAAWAMTGPVGAGRALYDREHIPGAVHFDIDAIADPASRLPHMLASPEAFAEAVGAMGVSSGDRIVVYDHEGLFSAPRVWWNFRVMGHSDVFVLDGGLPRWKAQGRPVSNDATTASPVAFEARFNRALVRDLEQVKTALADRAQVVDARAADRFAGAAPEPRAGLRGGHMPGATSLPWQGLVEDGALVSEDRLRAAFAGAAIDLTAPIVTSCGSGVSAATLALALARLGRWDVPVYDGSWTEWGGRADTAVA